LGYFPQQKEFKDQYSKQLKELNNELVESDGVRKQEISQQILQISTLIKEKQLENSYLGRIGKFVEPIIKPLGFDWRMGIALLSGTAAKEVVVSTMGVLYNVQDGDNNEQLINTLPAVKYTSGKKVGKTVFTPLVALAFLIFILIYSPCIGVIGAIAKESGHWKWSFFMIGYTTTLAWFLAFLVYQIGTLLRL
jgi:ferrous iron transport protein B